MEHQRNNKNLIVVALVIASTMVLPAFAEEAAEEEKPEPNWKNEAGLSYVGTTGNTDTSSFGFDYAGSRKPTPWVSISSPRSPEPRTAASPPPSSITSAAADSASSTRACRSSPG